MSIEGIIASASLPIPLLAALFWHARLYSLYRLLGERVENLSYYWFTYQFQVPQLARMMLGRVDPLSSLPDHLAAQVFVVRRDTRRAEIIIALWMLLIVILVGISFRH